MIRYFRIMAWLRWRILLNTIRDRGRRDNAEATSRILGVLGTALFFLMLVPACAALGGLAFFGGWYMGHNGRSDDVVIAITRVLVVIAILAAVIGPLVRSMQGSEVNIRRLLLLPIHRRDLHLSEVVSSLTDPWLLPVVPAMFLLPAGLMVGGNVAAGCLALVAALVMTLTLGAVSSLGSFATMLLFQDRRRGEVVTLILVLAFSLVGFAGLAVEGLVERYDKRSEERAVGGEPPPDLERVLVWARPFPSELYGHSVARAASGRPGSALLHLGGLIVACGVVYGLSGRTHRALLDNLDAGTRRRGSSGDLSAPRRLPGFSESVSAVAWTQFRTFFRTVRGKLAVIFTFAVVILLQIAVLREVHIGDDRFPQGPFLLLVGATMGILSQNAVMLNLFAVDRAGLTLQFLSPLSDREILTGKILGCGMLTFWTCLPCLIVAVAIHPDGHPLHWMSMVLTCVSAFSLLAPLSGLLSTYLPRAADIGRVGKEGNPHPLAGFLGVLLTVLAFLPALLLYTAGLLLRLNPALTFLAVALWTAVTVVLYFALIRVAAAAVGRRRENLLLVAAGR